MNGDGGMDVFRLNHKSQFYGRAPEPSDLNSPVLIDMNRKGLIAKLFRDETDTHGDIDQVYGRAYNRLLVLKPNGDKIIYKIDYNFYLNHADIPKYGEIIDYSNPAIYPLTMTTNEGSIIKFHFGTYVTNGSKVPDEEGVYGGSGSGYNSLARPFFRALSVLGPQGTGNYQISCVTTETEFKIAETIAERRIDMLFDPNSWSKSKQQRLFTFKFKDPIEQYWVPEIDFTVSKHPMFSKVIDPKW